MQRPIPPVKLDLPSDRGDNDVAEIAGILRTRRWIKLLQLAARHRREESST